MLNSPMDILRSHPIRKTDAQKASFRADLQGYAESIGYSCAFEETKHKAVNVILGDPAEAKYLITAHYDTPASIGLPNFLTPCNLPLRILRMAGMIGLLLLVAGIPGLAVGMMTSKKVGLIVWLAAYYILLFAMRMGPANKSNVNDNSSGVIALLEIARTMPQMHRDRVCFVLFDLEERGLVGSGDYRKMHKDETENQVIYNLDCVGDGDHIIFFPTKKARENQKLMDAVCHIGGWFGPKHIQVRDKGFYTYPSDQRKFPVAFGIAAFHKGRRVGYYLDKIHTKKDTVLEETNINLLRAAITTLVTATDK